MARKRVGIIGDPVEHSISPAMQQPAFDALLTGDSSWRELPRVMAGIADGSTPGLCHTIDWRDAA